MELSDVLADKLQFLGATADGLSVPQVLLIQIQVRTEHAAWKVSVMSDYTVIRTRNFSSDMAWIRLPERQHKGSVVQSKIL